MAWPLIAAAAMSTAETVGNNLMSEWHADKAQERQKELANIQFNHNQALQRAAMSNQVQGAKLAGLNPAMFNGQMSPSQSVSQGSAPRGENVEMNQTTPSDMLMMAQARNLEANTEKTEAETNKISGVDTENVKSDTALKTAQTIMASASTDKINEEAQNIRNTNEQYEDQNTMLQTNGQAMAQKWMNSDWYNNLAPDTKKTIKAMANGDLDLTVGGMKAMMDTIHLQENMSNADRKLIENAFANAITEAQFKDEKVMEALEKMPEWAQHKLKAEIHELLTRGDLNMHNANTVRDHLTAWKHENLGWLRANDKWGTYAASMAENLVDEVVHILGYIIAARNMGSAVGTAAKAASETPIKGGYSGTPKGGPKGPSGNGSTTIYDPTTKKSYSFTPGSNKESIKWDYVGGRKGYWDKNGNFHPVGLNYGKIADQYDADVSKMFQHMSN